MTRQEFIRHVELSQKALRRFLTALCCGDSQLADDIAQESYIKAYLSLNTITSNDKFNAWIFSIAYNTFLNSRRSIRPTANLSSALDINSEARTDCSFEYQALYKALELLPSKERSAILLFYMQGYPVKEIARIIDASEDAVKQYLSRGRKHLKYILKSPDNC